MKQYSNYNIVYIMNRMIMIKLSKLTYLTKDITILLTLKINLVIETNHSTKSTTSLPKKIIKYVLYFRVTFVQLET